MKTHAHRRPSPRRLATQRRQAAAATQVERRGRRSQGGATPPASQVARPATGLLIPRLAAGVPTAYENERSFLTRYIREMVEHGALKGSDAADSIDELLRQGVEGMLSRGLANYEDSWGEYVNVFVGHDHIDLCIYQSCHDWRMRLKPILGALTHEDGAAFIQHLNKSIVQGPQFWDDIIGMGDSDEPRPLTTGTAEEWLASLRANVPAFGGSAANQAEFPFVPAVTVSNPRLKELIARFVETDSAATCYADTGALMVTTWDDDCPVNHAHDYIGNALHNGDLTDEQCTYCYASSFDTIEELSRAMELIGNCMEAARELEEWSNAKL